MILPSSLAGFEKIPVIQKINSMSFIEREGAVYIVEPWASLRGIFEYVACVEFAKERLLNLPKGKALGSINITPARYDSASMVFFAQASLDNLAVWLNGAFELGLKGNNISFYKDKIKPALETKHGRFSSVLQKYAPFIANLNAYRMEWLHRLAGGAEIYSDKAPSDSGANISIQVPIDPTIPSLASQPSLYLERIQKVQHENGGRWLIPIDEFAQYIRAKTIELVIEILEVTVEARA